MGKNVTWFCYYSWAELGMKLVLRGMKMVTMIDDSCSSSFGKLTNLVCEEEGLFDRWNVFLLILEIAILYISSSIQLTY